MFCTELSVQIFYTVYPKYLSDFVHLVCTTKTIGHSEKENYSRLSWSKNDWKLMHICWNRLKGVACVLVIIVRGKTIWKLENIRKAINTGQRSLVQKYCLGTLLIIQSLGLVYSSMSK